MTERKNHESEEAAAEDFGELIKYSGAGFAGALILGVLLYYLEFQHSALGQWLVRTIAGEGESIFEGIYARLGNSPNESM